MEFDTQSSLPEKDIIFQLKKLREDNTRNSELVVKLVEQVIFSKPHIFGNDLYSIYEQLILAALDLARFDLVDQCMDILDSKFPDSMRVHKLKGRTHCI